MIKGWGYKIKGKYNKGVEDINERVTMIKDGVWL